MNAPMLEDIRLAQLGDEEAEQTLICKNTPLIWSVARRFFGRGADPEDLFQLGSIGFIKAVRGFDPQYGTQFSTYAVPKIAGEIKRFLRDDGMIKVSRELKENAMKVSAARASFEAEKGRAPKISELSERTGLQPEEIATCDMAVKEALSLDVENKEEDGPGLFNRIGVPGHEENVVERLALHEALNKLDSQERVVLELRYFRDMTQQKTAAVMGISQVQVSRIEKRAFLHLRIILQ